MVVSNETFVTREGVSRALPEHLRNSRFSVQTFDAFQHTCIANQRYDRHSQISLISFMVCATDLAKRFLVSVVRELATIYRVAVSICRDSADADVREAYKKVSLKCHPDRGGKGADQQRLNQAHDEWEILPHLFVHPAQSVIQGLGADAHGKRIPHGAGARD